MGRSLHLPATPLDAERAVAERAVAECAVAEGVRDPLRPLTKDERRRLTTGPEDEPIPVEIHYIQSNETRHDLFFPFIEGLGGAMIGVGSDPSFTMAAAAQVELLFMIDIDHRVVDLHQIYAVLIPEARSAEDLIASFERENRATTLARLDAAFAEREPAERRRLLQGYRTGRETVLRHLHRVFERHVDGQPASWLSSPRMFEHVQRLHRGGRVRVLPGDLGGEASVQSIAEATRSLGLEVRVLYMSNAEEYFGYSEQFIANIAALPLGERSVLLRTLYPKTWPHADLWAYQVQPLSDFRERLGHGSPRNRNAMLRQAEYEGAVDREPGPRGLSLLDGVTPP